MGTARQATTSQLPRLKTAGCSALHPLGGAQGKLAGESRQRCMINRLNQKLKRKYNMVILHSNWNSTRLIEG